MGAFNFNTRGILMWLDPYIRSLFGMLKKIVYIYFFIY